MYRVYTNVYPLSTESSVYTSYIHYPPLIVSVHAIQHVQPPSMAVQQVIGWMGWIWARVWLPSIPIAPGIYPKGFNPLDPDRKHITFAVFIYKIFVKVEHEKTSLILTGSPAIINIPFIPNDFWFPRLFYFFIIAL